jgi:acetyltransferase
MSIRAEVAEWQTRRSQTPLRATSCGFESHLRYHRWHLRTAADAGLGDRGSMDLESFRAALTTSHARSAGLDGVRAVGALLVFSTHLYWNGGIRDMGLLTPLGHTGSSGVAVFFVLSGYLIYWPFAGGGRVHLASYAARRFLRIYPAYLLALVGVAVVFGKPNVLAAPLTYLTLTQGLNGDTGALVPSWTLTCEVLFYASAPLLSLLVARSTMARELAGLGVLAVASFVCVLIAGSMANEANSIYFSKTFPLMFWTFVPGMMIAVFEANEHDIMVLASRPSVPIVGIGLVWLGLVSGLNPWLNVPIVLGTSAMMAWIVAARPRLPRAVGALGAISYGFYLWQYDTIEALVARGFTGPVLAVLALGASAAFAATSYLVVERPAIRLGRWISKRR